MKNLDLTLSTPEENLALEEALLEWAESTGDECLRFWESPSHFVVLGAGSPIHTDVNEDACAERHIPVIRRCSGGGTVLQGPGCLNYTFALDKEKRPELDSIASTNQYVLGSITDALTVCDCDGAAIKGYSDLTLGPLKFSGNAQRRRKRFILFHGTVLYGFDLSLISRYLGAPEKMPDYRNQRDHDGFVTNIAVKPDALKHEIIRRWQASEPMQDWPKARTQELALTRYADQSWIMSI